MMPERGNGKPPRSFPGIAWLASLLMACSETPPPIVDAHDGAPRDDVATTQDGTEDDGGMVSDVSSSDDAPGDTSIADASTDTGRIDVGPEDPNCTLPDPVPPPACGPLPDGGYEPPPRVNCLRTKRDLVTGIQPTSITGDARLRADAFGVYWVSAGDLMMLRSGAVVAETIASIGSQDYTFDNDAFYFGQETAPDIAKIVRMRRDRTETTTLVEGIDHTPLVVDGDRLYFHNADHYLASVPKTGGTAVATTLYMTARFVVDESYIYWAYSTSSQPSFYRAAKSGGDEERIPNDAPPAAFAWTLEGDTFFMFARFPFGIVSLPKTGGCVRALIMNIEGTFAVDERAIYWLESTSRPASMDHGGLWWAPRTGGVAVQVLEDAAVGSRFGSVVLTPSQVVVLTSNGTLFAVDRP